jgi:hypothetical protein
MVGKRYTAGSVEEVASASIIDEGHIASNVEEAAYAHTSV